MGLFITVEGGEYTGKTSVVVPGLARFFKKKGIPVLVSREPGGTPKAEAIRQTIFQKMAEGVPQDKLAALFMQARQNHLKEKVVPFLGEKKERRGVVILDRFIDSTRVYQGLEGGVALDKIRALEKKYVGGYFPDITIILYFPDDVFSKVLNTRMRKTRQTTAWDNHALEIQRQRQKYYLTLPELAKQWGEERLFIPIDASKTKEAVSSKVISAVAPQFTTYFGN